MGGHRGGDRNPTHKFFRIGLPKNTQKFFCKNRPRPPRCAARVRGPCRSDGACRWGTAFGRRQAVAASLPNANAPAALPSVRHGLRLGAPNVCPWKLNGCFSLAFMRPRIPPDYRRVSVARERSAEYRLGACSHFTHRNPTDEFPAPQSIPGDPARPAFGGEARRLAPCGALPLRVIPRGHRAFRTAARRSPREYATAVRKPRSPRGPRSGDRETKARLPASRLASDRRPFVSRSPLRAAMSPPHAPCGAWQGGCARLSRIRDSPRTVRHPSLESEIQSCRHGGLGKCESGAPEPLKKRLSPGK